VNLPESKFVKYKNFSVSDGTIINDLLIAYQTWGKLNQKKDNAILICHGYTNHHFACDKNIGWFNNLMGSGKGIDTDKYFVICSNMLGSSFGTTGPKSINPKTKSPYGSDFPKIKNIDIINVQKILIENMGINQLHTILGYSFGGHLVYLWATEFPDMIKKVVSVAGALDRWDVSKEKIEFLEKSFTDCKGWNNGHFYSSDSSEVIDALINYRIKVLNHYGFADYLLDLNHSLEVVQTIILKAAKGWAGHFDPNSLIILRRANIGSSAKYKAFKIKVPILKVLAKTDKVTSMEEGYSTIKYLKSLNIDCDLIELKTKFGHYGPMSDYNEWSNQLKDFLENKKPHLLSI
jgi:homoserine O-acetyltransferase